MQAMVRWRSSWCLLSGAVTTNSNRNVFTTQVDGKVAERLVFACRCPNYHPMYDLLVAYATGTNRTVPLSQRKVNHLQT